MLALAHQLLLERLNLSLQLLQTRAFLLELLLPLRHELLLRLQVLIAALEGLLCSARMEAMRCCVRSSSSLTAS